MDLDDELADLALQEHRLERDIDALRAQALDAAPAQRDLAGFQELTRLSAALSALRSKRLQKTGRRRAVLLETGSQPDNGDERLGAETTGVDVTVVQHMSHVPTGIAHLLDRSTPLVSFEVNNARSSIARLRFASRVVGFSADAMNTIELPPHTQVTLPQWPVFFHDRLSPITEMMRASLVIRIDDLDGKREREDSFAIWLLARSTALNGAEDLATGEWKDLSHFYGAWVTPNAEAVMDLLRKAADYHPSRRLNGYRDEPADVEEQVKAVFHAVKALGLTYVNSSISFGATAGRINQRVRLPRESLQRTSANCIDGTLLMASLLEAASLNPALVFMPGHAFLGWQKSPTHDEWDYLETTLIGSGDFVEAQLAGRMLAEQQMALREQMGDERQFVRHPLDSLRVRGISPME